jgi:hypothetical protein
MAIRGCNRAVAHIYECPRCSSSVSNEVLGLVGYQGVLRERLRLREFVPSTRGSHTSTIPRCMVAETSSDRVTNEACSLQEFRGARLVMVGKCIEAPKMHTGRRRSMHFREIIEFSGHV